MTDLEGIRDRLERETADRLRPIARKLWTPGVDITRGEFLEWKREKAELDEVHRAIDLLISKLNGA